LPGWSPRDPPLNKPLLEGNLCRHLQSPEAAVVAELSRGAVEHLPHGLGCLVVEGRAGSLGARGASSQSGNGAHIEVVDGVAHLLTGPHPNERAIGEARSLPLLARMIWTRRMTKASLECSTLSNCSSSVSESERTKMGGLMLFHYGVSHDT
jgi:hypothetical protein